MAAPPLMLRECNPSVFKARHSADLLAGLGVILGEMPQKTGSELVPTPRSQIASAAPSARNFIASISP
jgi:hypothetical protein